MASRIPAGMAEWLIQEYWGDPEAFCREALLLDLDPNQRAICDLVRRSKRVAVASAKGCGKSTIAAALAIWYALTRAPTSLVVVCANTASQTTGVLWRYIAQLIDASALKSLFEVNNEAVRIRGGGQPVIRKQIFNEFRPDSSRGVHAEHLLYIIDEASGLPSQILREFEGTCTQDDNRMLLISNPSRPSGYFFDCFKANSGWDTLSIDGRDSKLTNQDHISHLIKKYGYESDFVRVQVRGLFPVAASNRIISPELLERWFAATPAPPSGLASVLGLDVGAGGDETVGVLRTGGRFEILFREQTADLQRLIDLVVGVARERHPACIYVDKTGVGAFVPGEIRKALGPRTRVFGIDFGDAPPAQGADVYNMRAYMYRRLADCLRMDSRASLEGARDGVRDAVEATECFHDERSGKIRLVPKAQIVEAIGHSPDVLDACALACAGTDDLMATSSGVLRSVRREHAMRDLQLNAKF